MFADLVRSAAFFRVSFYKFNHMDMKQKLLYVAPESESIEVHLDGIIAASETMSITPGLDSPFGPEDTWSL